MWLSRTRRVVGMGALPQYQSAVREIQNSSGGAQVAEVAYEPVQAFQEMFKALDDLSARVAALERGMQAVAGLEKESASATQALARLIEQSRQIAEEHERMARDIQTLDRNVHKAYDEIKEHEYHSDEEKRRGTHCAERRSVQAW